LFYYCCGFVLYKLGANAVFVFACLCVFLAAARACMSLAEFHSIKQFRHLHGLLLRPEDPKNRLTVVQKPKAILTNICSHCEPLACDIAIYREEAQTGRYTHTSKPTANSKLSLICHFCNISGKPGGSFGSCCLFWLKNCAA